jgi:hypothetical protein
MVRRLLILAVLAVLALPASSQALDRATATDGTLSVKDASGTISIVAHGVLIGQMDKGKVTIDDPNAADGPPAVVTGFEKTQDLSDTASRWSGTDIRFRMIGGFFRVKVIGSGINLSFVGHGSVTLKGTGGSYSVNGGDYQDVPDAATTVSLGT